MDRRSRARQKVQTTEHREASVPLDLCSSSHSVLSLDSHNNDSLAELTHTENTGAPPTSYCCHGNAPLAPRARRPPIGAALSCELAEPQESANETS